MARHPRRFLIGTALSLALLGLPSLSLDAQPSPDASAGTMNAQLAAEHVARVGPSYLYPAHAVTPGLVNPDITQANIHQTICSPTWSTKTIRPPVTYTSRLKQQQLAHATDKNPAHYEEDHFISLELGGHPRDPRNLWPERWGTPAQPLTARGPFPSHLAGAKNKDAVENALHREVCAGTLTLREAQWIIATDWFKYYRERVLH
jgi:hypothetical protein